MIMDNNKVIKISLPLDLILGTALVTEFFFGKIKFLHTFVYIISSIFYTLVGFGAIVIAIVLYYIIFTNKLDSNMNPSPTTHKVSPLNNIFSWISLFTIMTFSFLTGHMYFFIISLIIFVFGRLFQLPIVKNTIQVKIAKNLLLGEK